MVDRIAVIDDDAMIRKSVTFLLSDRFNVQVYDSADSYLDQCQNENYQLPRIIILDLMMPGTNGKKLLKHLKCDTKLCKIPVIILSAKNDHAEVVELNEIGAAAYISKPFDFNELSREIDHILETTAA